jgi:hypothetical protein
MAGVLALLETQMEGSDLACCSGEDLASLTALAYEGQRQMDGYFTCLAAEARARERAGGSATAEDVMRCGGEVSVREAERRARRAGLADQLPITGQAAR